MCVFCDIIDGKIPSKKIYEDDKVLAILDISQATYGHTLVLPKEHYDNILECDKDDLTYLITKVQDIAKLVTTKLSAKGFNILVNTNEIAGQTVMHLHFHIIPRYNQNDTIKFEFKNNEYDLDEILKKISN